MTEIETTQQARQGKEGRPVLYVLAAAIVLAVIAGVGMLTWQGENAPATPSQQSTRETTSGSTGGDPIQKQSPGNPNNSTPAQPKAQ